jgi:hypothetical protein
MADRRIILSLVERGWQAARACSLDPKFGRLEFLHVVKGRLDPEVEAMIAPRPNVRIASVPSRLFWPRIWILYHWLRCAGRLRALLVDNDRSVRRLRGWMRGVPVHLVRDVGSADADCLDL